MAGRTEMVVGNWRNRFVHVPIPLAVSGRNQVDPDGDLWLSVLEATGQPTTFALTDQSSSRFAARLP
jgi:6-phosphofructokinase 1